MQRFIPNLWFDSTAEQAAGFYTSVFPESRIRDVQRYPSEGLPEFQQDFAGQPLAVEFDLAGVRFVGINGGPQFRPNPALSFMVSFDPSRDPDARHRLDTAWAALLEGGTELMELGEYPFSLRYGWVEDRYGVSWQLILTDPEGEPRPPIMASLLFGGPVQNRAAEALQFYAEVFGGRLGTTAAYGEPTGPATAEALMFAEVEVDGDWLVGMDSGVRQDFTFSPGVSLMLECSDQAEIDRYWERLSAVPQAEQCGWCVDRFGVSWQVVPANLRELMDATPDGYQRMLQMKKIEVAAFG